MFILLLSYLSFMMPISGQSKSEHVRKIIHKNQDSIFVFNVKLDPVKFTPKENKIYYWFKSDKIYSNQGGYAGHLLHGEYKLFNKSNLLLEEGYYDDGMKTGKWKKWNSAGILNETCDWEKGLKNGIFQTYDTKGQVTKTMEYKNDILNGKAVYFNQNPPKIIYYKDGKVLEKEKSENQKKKTKSAQKDTKKTSKKKPESTKKKKEEKSDNSDELTIFQKIKRIFTSDKNDE